MNQTPLTVNEPYRILAALTEGAQSELGGSHTGRRLTGQEFSLFVALLTDSNVVYQCMRFDSYWALADLTSIPDFFSQRSTFLRSVLPLWCWRGVRLPNLKPWMRVVFALYVVTVPGLALLLFLLVTRLPGIVVAAWGSLSILAREFSYTCVQAARSCPEAQRNHPTGRGGVLEVAGRGLFDVKAAEGRQSATARPTRYFSNSTRKVSFGSP